MELDDSVRDYLLDESLLEVKSLVVFSKNGGFARDFVYINNEIHKLCQTILEAIQDPT